MSTTHDLAGKVAIITGSSRGIGKGIAIHLGRRGASVVVNYTQEKSEAAAKEVVDEIVKVIISSFLLF
jgi:3-oxoacyl-[acyl-carrier protein] reductase